MNTFTIDTNKYRGPAFGVPALAGMGPGSACFITCIIDHRFHDVFLSVLSFDHFYQLIGKPAEFGLN